MEHVMIEVKNLDKSPFNVRRTAADIDDLLASIPVHGLMENLSVYPGKDGKYLVFAGGRRLAALRALQAEGKLPADYAVPCQVYTEEQAPELSLVENTVRLAMHPADQFDAFAALIDGGDTAGQVSQRFGCSEKFVVQRMKLARADRTLIEAYRAGHLTLAALEAFTVTDDHRKQLAVYESLDDGQKANPALIRRLLTDTMVKADDKLAAFVTLDTYQAAGGTVRTDLFREDIYLENPELLQALASEKLRLAGQELEAEGWGWVEVAMEQDWQATAGCGRIRPQPLDAPQELIDAKAHAEAGIEAIREEWEATDEGDEAALAAIRQKHDDAQERLRSIHETLASYAKYDPDQMKQAGCYAYIGHDGALAVERGLVRRQDAKKAAKASGEDKAKPKAMPETLKRDLAAYRLAAAQAEIAAHPAIALDLLAFQAARSIIAMRSTLGGADVTFRENHGGAASKAACGFVRERMEAVRAALPLDWQEADTEAEQFAAFQRLADADKQRILAFCVASSLQPKLDEGKAATAYDLALSQTGGDVAAYWRPTKASYLGRIPRDPLLALGRDLLGEQWSQARNRDTKGEIADQLERAFADPEKYARTPEQREKLTHWLPEGMAFVRPASERPAAKKPAARVRKRKAA